MSPVIILGGAISFVLAAFILLQSKRTIFWAAFVLVFTPIDYIKRYFVEVPTIARWLPLLTIMGFAMLSFLVITHYRAKTPRSLTLIYYAILAVGIISLMTNRSAVGAFIVAQRGYITIFAMLAMLKAVYYIYDKDDIMGFLVWAGLASSGAAFFQRVFFVMIQGRSGDMVCGLFPVDGIYLYYQLACIIIVISYWLHGRQPIRIPSQTVLLILTMSLAFGNNKAGFMFMGLVVLFIASLAGFKTVLRNFGKLLGGFALVGLVAVIFNSFYNKTYADSNEESFSEAVQNPDYLYRYMFGGKLKHQKFAPSGQLLRGASIEFAYNLIKEKPETLVVGMGPGSTQHSNMPGSMGWLEARYPGYTIGRVPLGMYLAEIGILGLILQIAFLFGIYYWKPKDPRADRPEFVLMRKAFVVMTLLFYIYENLYFEAVFALLIGALVYPNILGVMRAEEADESPAAEETKPAEAEWVPA
ncbi:MAG: hypothetical protein OHK0039_32730 [Bacteroidia bacterium]